jgi:glucose uptake protein GlcU
MSKWRDDWGMPSPDNLQMLDYGIGAALWTVLVLLAWAVLEAVGVGAVAVLLLAMGALGSLISRRRGGARSIRSSLGATVGLTGATLGHFFFPVS